VFYFGKSINAADCHNDIHEGQTYNDSHLMSDGVFAGMGHFPCNDDGGNRAGHIQIAAGIVAELFRLFDGVKKSVMQKASIPSAQHLCR
jgi:hypothetical protein